MKFQKNQIATLKISSSPLLLPLLSDESTINNSLHWVNFPPLVWIRQCSGWHGSYLHAHGLGQLPFLRGLSQAPHQLASIGGRGWHPRPASSLWLALASQLPSHTGRLPGTPGFTEERDSEGSLLTTRPGLPGRPGGPDTEKPEKPLLASPFSPLIPLSPFSPWKIIQRTFRNEPVSDISLRTWKHRPKVQKSSPSSCSESASGKLDPQEGLKKKCFLKFAISLRNSNTKASRNMMSA